MIRTYSELIKFETFEERFEYLKLGGSVGFATFGFDRYLNQVLYKSEQWKCSRDIVILRDYGCDLGIEGREIHGKIIIHHMNPITREEVLNRSSKAFNPEFLITTMLRTHNAIHYSDESQLILDPVVRKPYDTCPWHN